MGEQISTSNPEELTASQTPETPQDTDNQDTDTYDNRVYNMWITISNCQSVEIRQYGKPPPTTPPPGSGR